MPDQFSNMRFIVNPRAGNRRGDVETTIRQVLGGTGIVFDIIRTEHRGHATELARLAADDGIELVVAVGGDGMLNEVGKGLLERETILGLLPCGSGNGFGRSQGISLDPKRACSALLQADVRPIDVGKIGDDIFFSTAGTGLEVEVSRRYNEMQGNRHGLLTYACLTLDTYRNYTPEPVRITIEEESDLQIRPIILTVANTAQYGYGIQIAPAARPDDGWLDLCIVEDPGFLQLLWHSRRLLTGTIDRMPGVRMLRTRRVQIERNNPVPLQVDGDEVPGKAVLDVCVVPAAIRMALPSSIKP
jgi:YegS/Rv2252/BmrU family lipid kinase